MKKISIIIPCYNVENLIDRCLTSILDNDIDINELEIICIDDASTDSTSECLESWKNKYPDIFEVVLCEKNGRQGCARNIGIRLATGEWISFIDADDWVEKDYFSKLLAASKMHEGVEIVTCQAGVDFSEKLEYFTDDLAIDQWIGASDQREVVIDCIASRENVILGQYFGGVWAKIIRRDFVVKNNLFFSEGLVYEDIEWREMVHILIAKGVIIRDKLYHYYMNPMSTVRGMNRENHYDYIRILENWWDKWKNSDVMDDYCIPMVHEFLLAGYMQALRCFILRFDEPSFDRFLELRNVVNERIPQEVALSFLTPPNSIEFPFSEIQQMMLKLLYMNVNEADYKNIATTLKRIEF